MPGAGAFRPLLLMSGGFVVWAAHLTAIYAANALACARGFADSVVAGLDVPAFVAVLATVLALAALAALAFVGARAAAAPLDRATARTRAFQGWIMIAGAALASLAVIWDALPASIAPACA